MASRTEAPSLAGGVVKGSSTLGIITGSGPEAGLDLWRKILASARRPRGGRRYRGDLDAPRVIVASEPELGLSMDLKRHEDAVGDTMERCARLLEDAGVDYYGVACNTLHYFAPRLDALGLHARLVSLADVACDEVRRLGVDRVGLLGIDNVIAMGALSPYRALAEVATVVTTPHVDALMSVIHTVKTDGPDADGLADRWAAVVDSVDADVVLLACTELPLLPAPPESDKQLVDVTELLAAELARLAREGDGGAGGGAGGGGGGSDGDGDGGSGDGEGTDVPAASREKRQETIGKIVQRERRLAAEFANLQRGSKLDVEVGMCGDELDHWVVRLRERHFPEETALRGDMAHLAADWPGGVDHILLEVFFPRSYPRDPPFIRVVYPRFRWRTGHVNWGGSICLETLVNTGSPAGYKPHLTVETILLMVMFNMTQDTEGTVIKAGRIDFEREREFDRLDYSLEDGIENFARIAKDHGWDRQLDAARAGARTAEEKPAGLDELGRDFSARRADAATTSFK
mmetsp:Transcript_2001/g.6417  ORF Transcript_2001/g.6417 Transcript_2001/m.6417 type:complete len:517 (-) Transcript_2001:303-1853(-)